MSVINTYLNTIAPNLQQLVTNNDARMEVLKAESTKMQLEYNELYNSNQFLQKLIVEVEQLPKGEENNGTTEENIHAT